MLLDVLRSQGRKMTLCIVLAICWSWLGTQNRMGRGSEKECGDDGRSF